MKAQKKNRKTLWLILISTLLILAAITFFNNDSIKAYYYFTFKAEHFNRGDKVYLKKNIFNAEAPRVATLRAVRPLTIDEYELMHYWYSKEEAGAKYAQINFPEKTFLIKSSQDIDKEKIKRGGSYFIGTYKAHYFLKVQDPMSLTVFTENFYEITLNKNIITDEGHSALMPENYTWADDKIYIWSRFVNK